MRNRAITFALAVCFLSSAAFADNPTDAPLVVDDAATTVAQQDSQPRDTRRHQDKKDESASRKAKSKNSSRKNRQPDASNPGYPTHTGSAPSL